MMVRRACLPGPAGLAAIGVALQDIGPVPNDLSRKSG